MKTHGKMFTYTACGAGRFAQHDRNRIRSKASFSMSAVALALLLGG